MYTLSYTTLFRSQAEGVKNIVLSELGWSLHHSVRVQRTTFAQFHILANHRISANFDAFAKFRAGRHDGLRVNLLLFHFADFSALATTSRSTILHISVASEIGRASCREKV